MKIIEESIINKSTTGTKINNRNNTFLILDGNMYDIKEHTAKSQENEEFISSTTNIGNNVKERETHSRKSNEVIKRKILNLLKNDHIEVGYDSVTEIYLNDLLEENPIQTKEVINLVYRDIFDKPELLQNFIEVMSNLDYQKLHPTNTILALGVINHKDIGVQEAAIAAYEKWDDKENIIYLNNINYTADWIGKYAKSVIDYLESC